MNDNHIHTGMAPWNKGKLIGQKPPLRLHEIWSIRIRLEVANKIRDLALFNLAIDSKLRKGGLQAYSGAQRSSGAAQGSRKKDAYHGQYAGRHGH